MRLATMLSGVNYKPWQPPTVEEKKCYIKAVDQVEKLPLAVFQTSKLSEIRLKIRKKHYDLVVVDYIQRILTGDSNVDRNRYQRIGHVCEELERLALQQESCIIALSQLHRPTETGGGSEPSIHWYRDSGEIEESAAIACTLWYPYQNANDEQKDKHQKQKTANLLHFSIGKNNLYGVKGRIDLRLDKQNLRIREETSQ